MGVNGFITARVAIKHNDSGNNIPDDQLQNFSRAMGSN